MDSPGEEGKGANEIGATLDFCSKRKRRGGGLKDHGKRSQKSESKEVGIPNFEDSPGGGYHLFKIMSLILLFQTSSRTRKNGLEYGEDVKGISSVKGKRKLLAAKETGKHQDAK